MNSFLKLCFLIALLFSINTAYAYDFEVDGIYYEVISTSELTCKVVKGDKGYSGDIVIPTEVSYKNRTLKVTSIGKTFMDNYIITSITLPNSVTSIECSAFKYCSSLTSIKLPDSLKNIESETFYGCRSLTSIMLPDSLTSIGNSAFYGCSSLTSIKLPDSLTIIEDSVFYGCSSLTSIKLPDSLTIIGDCVFYGCSSLKSIKIPNSVTWIGYGAFMYCRSLKSIEIPNSVTWIGFSAFGDCSSLTNIKLSENLERIKYETFYNCSSLESIVIPASVKEFEQYLKTRDDGIYLTFYNCNNLKSIRFEHSNTLLNFGWGNNSYFYTCGVENWTNTLESIYIDRKFNYSIKYLNSLKEIIIGENLDELDIVIKNGNNLTSITSYALIPPKIPACTNSQYMDVKVRVPYEALEAYQQANGWKEFWDLEGFDPAGIDDIQTATEKTEIARYNLLGAPVSPDYKGIVIIRFSDGSTKKFVNK